MALAGGHFASKTMNAKFRAGRLLFDQFMMEIRCRAFRISICLAARRLELFGQVLTLSGNLDPLRQRTKNMD